MNTLKEISNSEIIIAPSLLASDFANLENEAKKINKCKNTIYHLDVMDGHFVPNISFGAPIVSALRKHSTMIFDAHLMISKPLDYIDDFVKSGANHITFHIESSNDAFEVVQKIKSHENVTVGISLKPKTPVEIVIPFLNMIDMVLVMTVEPGFGGQSFMNDMMSKVSFLRKYISDNNLKTHIQVDGGIGRDTIQLAAKNGANCFVAGTSLFKAKNSMPGEVDSFIELAKGC